jgi:hypothetical protein
VVPRLGFSSRAGTDKFRSGLSARRGFHIFCGRLQAVPKSSTILFDTVAVYLAYCQDWCGMERLGIRVTDDGLTVEEPGAKKMSVAMTWKDLTAFEGILVSRLTRGL